MNAKKLIIRHLNQAGVQIVDPHADDVTSEEPSAVRVHDERFYRRVLAQGSLGLGESYMDGWWDCEALDEMIARVLRVKLDAKIVGVSALLPYLLSRITNQGRKGKAFEVGEKHYDIGNDLYSAMLDRRMTYTCAYWNDLEVGAAHGAPSTGQGRVGEGLCIAVDASGIQKKSFAANLNAAQEAKLDLVCRKLGLDQRATGDDGRPLHILDIGCGWGSFAIYAAEKYGVRVTGITISKEQAALAKERAEKAGVADKVEFILQDYRDLPELLAKEGRDLKGAYDHVVSLGMFEHVGHKNYKTYFDVAKRVLKPEGLFVLQTIGHNRKTSGVDPWITKYIFPNGMIPQSHRTVAGFEGKFIMEDWHNFGPDYDKTLMAWYENFEAKWPDLKNQYNERFYRMWRYYLLACAGAFRARSIQLWQIVLSPNGVPGGYTTVR